MIERVKVPFWALLSPARAASWRATKLLRAGGSRRLVHFGNVDKMSEPDAKGVVWFGGAAYVGAVVLRSWWDVPKSDVRGSVGFVFRRRTYFPVASPPTPPAPPARPISHPATLEVTNPSPVGQASPVAKPGIANGHSAPRCHGAPAAGMQRHDSDARSRPVHTPPGVFMTPAQLEATYGGPHEAYDAYCATYGHAPANANSDDVPPLVSTTSVAPTGGASGVVRRAGGTSGPTRHPTPSETPDGHDGKPARKVRVPTVTWMPFARASHPSPMSTSGQNVLSRLRGCVE